MTRLTLLTISCLMATIPAFAHPGHLAESGGHSHWLVVAAAVFAILIGLGAFVRRRIHR